MGCDIHLYVERRVNGAWESCDYWVPDEDAEEGESPRLVIPCEKRFYKGRNYNLFAILADVRNGRGFAGVRTGDGLNPICEAKGMPDDASPNVKAECESWDCDGHSHSWHTIADLLAYDWTQETRICGYIDAPTFFQWDGWARKNGESPDRWCGDVRGPDIKHVSENAMHALIKDVFATRDHRAGREELKKHFNTYVHCEWTQPYYKCSGNFFGHCIPRLLRLGKPEDVRIVFWFDN